MDNSRTIHEQFTNNSRKVSREYPSMKISGFCCCNLMFRWCANRFKLQLCFLMFLFLIFFLAYANLCLLAYENLFPCRIYFKFILYLCSKNEIVLLAQICFKNEVVLLAQICFRNLLHYENSNHKHFLQLFLRKKFCYENLA